MSNELNGLIEYQQVEDSVAMILYIVCLLALSCAAITVL